MCRWEIPLAADPAPTDRPWIALSANRPIGAFCFGERRWRVIYRVKAGEAPVKVMSENFISQQLRRAYPDAVRVRHRRASSFRLGQGQTHRYWQPELAWQGRWALAGDSAHARGPSLGILGAWRLSQHLITTLANESTWPEQAGGYEQAQRRAAYRVQRSNARIFRSMMVTSPVLAAARTAGLTVTGRIPVLADRMTADAALIELAPKQAVGSGPARGVRTSRDSTGSGTADDGQPDGPGS